MSTIASARVARCTIFQINCTVAFRSLNHKTSHLSSSKLEIHRLFVLNRLFTTKYCVKTILIFYKCIVYVILGRMLDTQAFCVFYRVVKEEITDDESGLPCVNGRVVAWVCITDNLPKLYCIKHIHVYIYRKSVAMFPLICDQIFMEFRFVPF